MNRENKLSQFIFITLIIVYGLISCNTTDPPDDKAGLLLKLEDVSCTEAWITLTTNNLQLPATINLLKDNNITKTINLQTADTLLYLDSLLPNQTYNFHSVIQSLNQSSNELSITTIDTTSHNFTWQTFTFGDFISSTFWDVAIISEEIWAVGEIQISDTSETGYTTYNAVHWDGIQWNLHRIMFYTICGQQHRTSYPAKSIFAFNENEIWIAMDGDQIAMIENGIQTQTICLPWSFSINKLWGIGSNELYAVGDNSNIVRYLNGQWSRIESGTDTDFKDIYGTLDGKELWTCGWTNRNGRVAIVKIKENGVESIWDSQTNRQFSYYYGGLALNTLWANGNSEFVLGTGNIIRHSLLDKTIIRNDWIYYPNGSRLFNMENYAYQIRGSNKNNIAAAGDCSMIWHYNGKSWHKFEEIYDQEDRLYGMAVSENLIVAVGKRYSGLASGALIHIGRR